MECAFDCRRPYSFQAFGQVTPLQKSMLPSWSLLGVVPPLLDKFDPFIESIANRFEAWITPAQQASYLRRLNYLFVEVFRAEESL